MQFAPTNMQATIAPAGALPLPVPAETRLGQLAGHRHRLYRAANLKGCNNTSVLSALPGGFADEARLGGR